MPPAKLPRLGLWIMVTSHNGHSSTRDIGSMSENATVAGVLTPEIIQRSMDRINKQEYDYPQWTEEPYLIFNH
jgi:hypothetical protein